MKYFMLPMMMGLAVGLAFTVVVTVWLNARIDALGVGAPTTWASTLACGFVGGVTLALATWKAIRLVQDGSLEG